MFMTILAAPILTGLLTLLSVHPLHVTVTEIEMDEKEKQLEITMRVFVDDLEQTMRNKFRQPALDILKPNNGLTVDQMMSDYLHSHFRILLDAKPQQIKYLGHETDGDAFVFYLEVTHLKKWKNIEILNNGMMETFDDQSNLVHVSVQEELHSLRLTANTPSGKLTFEAK